MYLLNRGLVRMYYADLDGNEHNKRFFMDSDFFWPVTHALRTQPTGFFIETLTETEGYFWQFDAFQSSFSNDYEWLTFSHVWMEKLLEAKLTRERQWLQLTASERYIQFCQHSPKLAARLPAHQVASYIGITPVSLSRLKKHLIVNI